MSAACIPTSNERRPIRRPAARSFSDPFPTRRGTNEPRSTFQTKTRLDKEYQVAYPVLTMHVHPVLTDPQRPNRPPARPPSVLHQPRPAWTQPAGRTAGTYLPTCPLPASTQTDSLNPARPPPRSTPHSYSRLCATRRRAR